MSTRLDKTAGPPNQANALAHILLVDDELPLLNVYARILTADGYEVTTASNGNQAIQLLSNHQFDLIISDINMPHMGGMELLRKVRLHDLDVPILLITGDPALDTAVQALEYGAFHYLIKPIDNQTFHDTVRRAVRLHKMAKLKRQALELIGSEGKWLGDRAALEGRFAQALETLWMALQPIVSLKTKTVFGYEALVRTQEPTLASPADFLTAAERLKRLHDLGRTIRLHVAKAVDQAPPHIKLFMNLHSLDLNDEALYEPEAPLSLVASRVVLEITERASLDEVRNVRDRIAALRRFGFSIAVDDLGAGYAGLTSFSQLDPEIVKLDMSLVRGIVEQPKKQSVVRSLTRLSEELGMLVVTEGIETPEERDTLLALGCDLMQGYLFAKPGRDFPQPVW